MAEQADLMGGLAQSVANLAEAIAGIHARLDAIEADVAMIHRWAATAQANLQALNGRQGPAQDTALNFGSPGA